MLRKSIVLTIATRISGMCTRSSGLWEVTALFLLHLGILIVRVMRDVLLKFCHGIIGLMRSFGRQRGTSLKRSIS